MNTGLNGTAASTNRAILIVPKAQETIATVSGSISVQNIPVFIGYIGFHPNGDAKTAQSIEVILSIVIKEVVIRTIETFGISNLPRSYGRTVIGEVPAIS